MGALSSANEARQRSYALTEDTYKRKSQRSKIKDALSSQDKAGRCSLTPLKFIIVVIVCATVITLLHAPPICNTDHFLSHSISRPNLVKKFIWGSTDPRYESHLDMNWNDIKKALTKLKQNEYHSVGLLNFNLDEITRWKENFPLGEHTELHIDYADEDVTWESLYPEWIDEEEEEEVPTCPSLPRLDTPRKRIDLIAVKLPCHKDKANWSRDVARLHLQLATAGLASSAKGNYPVHLLLLTECFPIPNLFPCKELVVRQGNSWLYKPTMNVLREKLGLPIGSCELALPLKEANYKGLFK
ncbi:hypothetical protein V2J09_021910 [Rumex salicifolius]